MGRESRRRKAARVCRKCLKVLRSAHAVDVREHVKTCGVATRKAA